MFNKCKTNQAKSLMQYLKRKKYD